jgi:hypothetical protein
MNDLILASVQVGDVLRVSAGNYVLAISRDRHAGGMFYYTPCNFDVSLTFKKYEQSAANYINSSIMLSMNSERSNYEIVNSIELKKYAIFHNCAKYEWHLTGDYAIDCYMSHLDQRYSLFTSVGSEIERRQYSRDEDRNYHAENATMVAKFAAKILVFKILKAKIFKSKAA